MKQVKNKRGLKLSFLLGIFLISSILIVSGFSISGKIVQMSPSEVSVSDVSSSGSVGSGGGGSGVVTAVPVCGNGVCEEAENTYCPTCKSPDPNISPCPPCYPGTCPSDCSNQQSCTDSDGVNFLVNGETYGMFNGVIKTWKDYCVTPTVAYDFTCRTNIDPSSHPLDVWVEGKTCPNGCKDGLCLSSPTPVCGNGICEAGESNCQPDCGLLSDSIKPSPCGSFGNVNLDAGVSKVDADIVGKFELALVTLNEKQRLNADVNGDGIVNIVDAQQIIRYVEGLDATFKVCQVQNAGCTDSDGGINYNVKGLISSGGKVTNSDVCVGNPVGGQLLELSCGANGELQQTYYSCPVSCIDGACSTSTKTVCSDSDGRDFYTKGETYGTLQAGNGPETKIWTDYCINSNTVYDFTCNIL